MPDTFQFNRDTGAVDQSSSSLLSALTDKFGLSTALAILRLIDPNSSTAGKAFAGAKLGGQALQAGGALSGSPALSSLGKGVGTALGVAGTGYGISQIASNPNLSTSQKAGHSAGELANLIASLFVPYYGLGVAARAVNQTLARSGSPQISGAAKGASGQAAPVEGLISVLGGDTSIKGAFKHMGQTISANPARAFMDPVTGSIFGALGIGNYKPTEGTQFRTGLQGMFKQLGLPDFNRADKSIYNIDPAKYDAFAPDVKAAANQLSGLFAKKNPQYQNQSTAILLNTLSPEQILDLARKQGGQL